jgi:3-dehydroquinate dehydratase type I
MICIPIVAGTHAGAMRTIERGAAAADVIELRMDLIHNGRLVELINQARDCDKAVKVLVTHRRKARCNPLAERKRIDVLKEAVQLGADYVDVELETDRMLREELLTTIKRLQNRTALIVSHHDFRRTPTLRALKTLFKGCVKAGAEIVKIVTWARSPEDNLWVLRLFSDAKQENIGLIAFCMGPEGRLSRIAAPILGSCLSYVTLHRGGESAAGQLTLREMNTVMEILRRGQQHS